MVILKIIDKILSEISIFFIKLYQKTFSPDKWIASLWLKWKVCMHTPHCSEYSLKSFKRYWFFAWLPKAVERVFSCTWGKEKIYNPEYYKIVFFSSAPIATPFLKKLKKNKNFEVVWTVTMPDTASWRWMQIKPNIIKTQSEKLWIKDIKTPNSLRLDSKKHKEEAKNFHSRLKEKNPDFLVVIAYGKIIPKSILDIPKIAPINIHGSILPKYRWASPLQSVFLNWEKETWITIMKMDENMDTGNIIDIKKFKIKFERTVKDLIDTIMEKWPKFLNKILIRYWKNILWELSQNESNATYCQKIQKEDWEIEPYKNSLKDIYKKYRAYYLRPKIFFINKDWKRIVIENIKIDKNMFDKNKDKPAIEGKKLNEAIVEISLKPEWKKQLNREEFKSWYLK